MENQNQPTNDMAKLNQMFSNYKKSNEKKTKKTSEEILAKYFEPRKSKEYFRILPPKDGKYYDEAYFHVVDINGNGGKLKKGSKVYCTAKNNPKVPKLDPVSGEPVRDPNNNIIMVSDYCPLCEKQKKKLAEQDKSIAGIKKENLTEAQKPIFESNKAIFTESNKWEAKKFYILRGVDKGAEKDGVKFWRFKHNFMNKGTMDMLMPALQEFIDQNQCDFTDVERGGDLSITVGETTSPMIGTYKTITALNVRQPSKLQNDPIIQRQWLEDDITWREVYLPKKAKGIDEYKYLELVAEGNSPYWDDSDAKNKRWVFPNHPDLEAIANTRTANLDADEEYSSADEDEYRATPPVDENTTDLGASLTSNQQEVKIDITTSVEGGDDPSYNDLPF